MSSLYNKPFIYEALVIPLSSTGRETAKLHPESIQQGDLLPLALILVTHSHTRALVAAFSCI